MNEEKWTTKDIPDLTGKVFIVTGANSGLGFEAAKEFARNHATTILACRDLKKGERALERIRKEVPEADAEVRDLDLSSLASVRDFTQNFKLNYSRLDVLLNNAGIMLHPYKHTEDGFESHMGVNHLGHFALTAQVFELIEKTSNSRIVSVSSIGHKRGEMDFDNFLFEDGEGYSRFGAYGRSKLSNLLFTYELDRRMKKANIDAIAVAAHPGMARTNLGRVIPGYSVFMYLFAWFIPNAAKGALPEIRAATDPSVKGSQYYGPKGRIRVHPVLDESNEASHNEEDATRLWELSEELTGVKFTI